MPAKIWAFFAKVNVSGVTKRKCLTCGDLLPTPKDSSTSNMINHLRSKGHEEDLQKYEAHEMEKTTKITSFYAQKERETERQNQMEEQLVRIMVRQNASMYLFDDPDEQNRTMKAYPGLQIYGRLHFSRQVVPRMAADIQKKIVDQVGPNYFAITSDGWTNPSRFPALLSVTVHTLSEEFERHDNVLATIEIRNEHTGEEIARLIEGCLAKNKLKMRSLVACVRDDARNMQKSCRLLEIESYQCSAHFYHLIVIAALKSHPRIKELIGVVRQWVVGTHRSTLSDLLGQFQKAEDLLAWPVYYIRILCVTGLVLRQRRS